MPVPGSRLEPKVVPPAEMEKQVSVEHDPNKCGPDQNVQSVETCGHIERSAVHPVGHGKRREYILHAL